MTKEGFVNVPGGRVWYQILGEQGVPLLCLHGGPGFTHNYLETLGQLADRRRVIFYDQLGCGRSDRPSDKALWTVDRFVEELVMVVDALELDSFHLFGSSWGAMLAVQYVLDHRPPVASLILSGGPFDMPRYIRDLQKMLAALPTEVQQVIERHEASGFVDCPEYQGAAAVFFRRHLCRMDPWPEAVERSFAENGAESFREMQGPSETAVTGNFKDFNVVSRLAEITVPILVTCGRYDNCSPEYSAAMVEYMVNARLVVFENSAHMPFLEEPDKYMVAANKFLDQVDKAL